MRNDKHPTTVFKIFGGKSNDGITAKLVGEGELYCQKICKVDYTLQLPTVQIFPVDLHPAINFKNFGGNSLVQLLLRQEAGDL